MNEITRFGVSLPTDLLESFDTQIDKMGYGNRSKAIADLIRNSMIDDAWDTGQGEVVGIVTMVYDHHTSDTVNKLLTLQHDSHVTIYSTMHIHLDHDNCLEILAIRGSPAEVRKFSDATKSVRGVKHSGLVVTSKEL
ncbi:MAG: nickel-responsive transcriptional regulator NikR [Candidatus Thermoplasmatota archaeon]|nr:nickel-responsive transcriptional regulator NikR [Euryarchaeota archaeon]MBU4031181.1 nickel-responsive transcriptional regulator NikR [Candidatus Thermoplasmatota archaeon]MBU4071309.1 nickel-responsive transcriptional regulator NikR [Candidatus Thermoplasmatota archaeon]MBU4143396.1 nickel-responsive transcriptional regulator NikR [Candidatus Thermoplasmatota archaeon]MBU4592213.1 nickel-responsive transcriptional regulator NikR [Candidatus Thermoplasmatota archaeon]